MTYNKLCSEHIRILRGTILNIQGRDNFSEVIILSTSLTTNIASVSAHGIKLSTIPYVGLHVGQCVSLSVQKVYCGKMADWIPMPLGMVSAVSQWMGVLNGMEIVIIEGEGTVLGVNLGQSIHWITVWKCVN